MYYYYSLHTTTYCRTPYVALFFIFDSTICCNPRYTVPKRITIRPDLYIPIEFIRIKTKSKWKKINSNLFDCLVVKDACVFTIYLSQVAFGKIDF